jgi:hypothetical protein
MNTGVDYSIAYYDANQQALVNLGDIQDVKITAQHHTIKNQPYNADPSYGYINDGYTVDFTITRTGPVLEDLMITFAQQFAAGQVQKPGVLNVTVANPDGTISRYQYTKFVIFMSDMGDIARDKVVTQRMQGMASTKVKIA